ncbi:translation initiation factor IF-2 [Candidatus Laterigemmans baculatus]|uniref:translation initiation factor IF-2 n=1 Tax=Candidatus Laterigemmans baculatus TaxID=2770505 RepID=UPI0013DD12C6|nr:translation initiation factor IF-2 [Candidatus Laterigemmans baculatus]
MPVRIYALAKELKVDSKDLAEICKKVGLTGKGSALASLDDDEVQRVKDHLAAAAQKKQASAVAVADTKPAPVAPMAKKPASIVPSRSARPGDAVRRANTPISLRSAALRGGASRSAESEAEAAETAAAEEKPKAPAADTAAETVKAGEAAPPKADAGTSAASAPAAEAAEPKAAAAEKQTESAKAEAAPSDAAKDAGGKSEGGESAAAPAAKKPSDAPQKPSMPDTSPASITRGPLRGGSFTSGGKMRVLGRSGGGGGGGSREGGGNKPKSRTPVINLAALPAAKQPTPSKPAAGEPAAQKPEIRLSKDVIAGHKQGMKAPLEALQQQEKEKAAPSSGKGGLSSFTGGEKGRGRGAVVGREGRDEEEKGKKGLAGMASARAVRGKGRRRANQRQDIERSLHQGDGRRRRTLTRKGTNTAAPRKEKVQVELPCTLRSFCEAAGVPVAQVLRVLMGMGVMVNINATIDQETAELIAAEMDLDIELKTPESLEEELISGIEETEDSEEQLLARPPIVTFLGHVDHGKTSLLDKLVGIDVAKGEAGGITQHIRAYQIDKDDQKVTFVDTPGHEAFTEMRARGANVTDVAVLVIAADDGIMPQTEEAISHIKAAGVPIVVAMNKIDLEGADPTRVMTQMTEHGLTPSEWGGDVEIVRTSAITGEGLDELLETLLAIAELNEYRANPDRTAYGVCIESEQQGDRGVIAKVVVQNGTLRVGDVVVCGAAHGRVRAMRDTLNNRTIKEAGPSTPVNLFGLDQPPDAGDRFHVLSDIGQAREIAASRADSSRAQSLSGSTTKVSFERFQSLVEEGRLGQQEDVVRLNLIIRADVRGSLQAIDKELEKLAHPEVSIRVLQRAVGGITVADVTLASASDAVILGFNVIPDEAARSLADQRGVEIRRYSVIYQMTDDLKAILEGRLRPEERVVELGRALVKQVFQVSRSGTIAGCYVAQGVIERGCRIRVNRDGRTIGDYAMESVRRVKEDVKEVPRGLECGIKLAGFNDIRQDDVLEAYKIQEVARTLD